MSVVKTIEYYLTRKNRDLSYLGAPNWDFIKSENWTPKDIDRHNIQTWDMDCIQFKPFGYMTILSEKLKHPIIEKTWDGKTYEKTWRSGGVTGTSVIDIYNPGVIACVSNIPQGGFVPSWWLYFEEHPHDKGATLGKDVLFELDGFESGPSSDQSSRCVFFTIHHGNGYPHNSWTPGWQYHRKNLKIYGSFESRQHLTMAAWDGKGRFVWFLNGVEVFDHTIDLVPGMKPTLKLTQAVTRDGIGNRDRAIWTISKLCYYKVPLW